MRPLRTYGRPRAQRQRGLAAIMAILVVALAATTAIYLVWQQTVALRQIENLGTRAQVREVARAGTSWAAAIISQDDPKTDNLTEAWAQPLPSISVEQATLEGGMIDEQSKFNLNMLWSAAAPAQQQQQGPNAPQAPPNQYVQRFRIMLAQLGLQQSLCDALIDWIDTDSIVTPPGGAEDSYYLGQDPPYRAANNFLATVGELRLVKGFTAEVVERLTPYVTALPPPTTLNVNTMTAEMLSVFLPEVDPGAVLDARKRAPFTSIDDFRKAVGDQAFNQINQIIDVKSSYFSARARVTQGRTSITYRAILQRAQAGWPTILSITEEPM